MPTVSSPNDCSTINMAVAYAACINQKTRTILPLLSLMVSTVLSNEVLGRPHVEGGMIDDPFWSFTRSV